MNETEWIELLIKEGCKNASVAVFGPNEEIPEHVHDNETIHAIVKGEFIMIKDEQEISMKAGDRFAIPKGEVHSVRIGPEGCTLVVADK